MILEKRTHHVGSVSLSLDEFEEFKKGTFKELRVSGPEGRLFRTIRLNAALIARFIRRSILLPTRHKDADGDTKPPGDQAWYWVVNLA